MSIPLRLCCIAALAASGASACAAPAYGVFIPPPHDPSVTIEDFSYTPASPIHVDDTLTLQAALNKPTNAAYLQAIVKKPKLATIDLNDYGYAPDVAAGDGVYSGEIAWSPSLGPCVALPVWVELKWLDNAPGQQRDGPLLTVLPKEAGQ